MLVGTCDATIVRAVKDYAKTRKTTLSAALDELLGRALAAQERATIA